MKWVKPAPGFSTGDIVRPSQRGGTADSHIVVDSVSHPSFGSWLWLTGEDGSRIVAEAANWVHHTHHQR